MVGDAIKTSGYRKIPDIGGNCYLFFCDVSGALLCRTAPVPSDTPERELAFAWEAEGKMCFNRCRACGRWVSDAAYNADTLACIECSPWEEKPSYCPHCGATAKDKEIFCERCGNRLQHGTDSKDCRGEKTESGLKRPCSDVSEPYAFGFGLRVMKETKVCCRCGSEENAGKVVCSKCGDQLTGPTLFQIYQRKHRSCAACGTVLDLYMRYCPHCGKKIR